MGRDFYGQSALAKQINVRTPSGKLTDTLLSDFRTGVKAVNVDLDGCESAIWMKADSDFDEDDAYKEPSSVGHPLQGSLIVSSPPGSLPRTASVVDNTDPSAEETRAELLDGALLSVSYGERIHKTDVDEVERFGSIWRMDAAPFWRRSSPVESGCVFAEVDVSLRCEPSFIQCVESEDFCRTAVIELLESNKADARSVIQLVHRLPDDILHEISSPTRGFNPGE
ncbi:hypothetical protein EV421DRAFT_974323 [Armillaria borealis]|uniref:Uncharacterized protein n=1 Tax=Armillaria borealis TaxID=47425 RepID=A0AA39J9M1_9AGAR|nr:hypothetical protein EV421DRAFT_974323 [Armillaria borealis]